MTIDTKKTVVRLRFRSFIITIILLVVIVLVTQFIPKELFGLKKLHYVLIFNGLYLSYFIWMLILDRYYIYYSDEGKDIILRYFPLRPLVSSKQSVQIPKNTFYRFETKHSFFRLKMKLTLHQKFKGKAATYPPVNINILNEKELSSLRNSLRKFTKK